MINFENFVLIFFCIFGVFFCVVLFVLGIVFVVFRYVFFDIRGG